MLLLIALVLFVLWLAGFFVIHLDWVVHIILVGVAILIFLEIVQRSKNK